ncbi:MAG: RTX toxin, partial [SAR324 cluster bacterium]|nr:RTX toxin [SAR324 cluster bacterium]
SFHTCARLDNGTIKCWGKNDYGQLGLGDKLSRGTSSADMGDALSAVDLGASAIELSSGYQHSCALLVNGKVKCWGFNQFGQLGLGDTRSRGDASSDMGSSLDYVDLGTQ